MAEERFDIVLVVPAFADAHIPALGVSVLAAQCRRAGLRAHVHYANLELWREFPIAYECISRSPNELQLGEAVFAPHAFDVGADAFELALASDLGRGERPRFRDFEIESLAALNAAIDVHLERTARAVAALGAPVVGLTSSFQQNTASVAIARRLKRFNPSNLIIMGGANVEGEMGQALLEIAPDIDVIFSGEADVALPSFLSEYLKGGTVKSRFVECGALPNMELTSGPDYADYFVQLEKLPFSVRARARFPHFLPFESSRGCWWGEKRHCTFCGLNRQGMAYRSKSDDAIYAELTSLHMRWNEANFAATDNIIRMPSRFPLIQRLASAGLQLNLFVETKANLSWQDLVALRAAGISAIQPGIESLSSTILRKIDKGLKAPQAITLLRDASTLGIEVYWNHFSEIPNDRDEDFAGLADLIVKLVHLRPPVSVGPIRVDRFSPYFQKPAAYEIANLRPFDSYRLSYPPQADLQRLAYHFDYERSSLPGERAHRNAFLTTVEAWRARWRPRSSRPQLEITSWNDCGLMVHDSRVVDAPAQYLLEPTDILLLLQFARPQPLEREAEPDVTRLIALDLIVVIDQLLISVLPLDPRGMDRIGDPADAQVYSRMDASADD